eukprot:COSAG02_NODE_88_length_38629_cov_457.967999_7_plen_217_part_00
MSLASGNHRSPTSTSPRLSHHHAGTASSPGTAAFSATADRLGNPRVERQQRGAYRGAAPWPGRPHEVRRRHRSWCWARSRVDLDLDLDLCTDRNDATERVLALARCIPDACVVPSRATAQAAVQYSVHVLAETRGAQTCPGGGRGAAQRGRPTAREHGRSSRGTTSFKVDHADVLSTDVLSTDVLRAHHVPHPSVLCQSVWCLESRGPLPRMSAAS